MAVLKYKSSNGTWKTIVIKGDSGIREETDPVFSASPAASITETKKAEWDGKLDKTEAISTYLTKADAQTTYLGINAKAKSAELADKATQATRATQDAVGRNLTVTYATKAELNNKQDEISDLATIRSGAAKGATALQSVPDEYVTKTELNNKADKNNYTEFSTEETRIGTWIDGKPIYRKTIVYTCEDLTKTKFWAYYPSDTTGTEISAMNIDSYVGMSGVTFCANQAVPAGAWQPIPRVCPDANEAYNIGFGDLKPTRVGVLFGNKYLSATVYLTIEYTKTTD